MRVAIRVDSSTAIGSGHLMRCLTLAEWMWKEKNAKVQFISRDLDGNLNDKVKAAGFFLQVLPRHPLDESLEGYAAWLTVPQEVDAAETKEILQKVGKVDRLVVDNYALDIVWERELRPLTDEIFVIDDLANRAHDCDILLDQNFYFEMEHRYDCLVPTSCKKLLGPRYLLLREEFYEAKKHARVRTNDLHNILVFYGGSDCTNETMKALFALEKMNLRDIIVQVVVGSANSYKAEIEAFCRQYPWMEYCCQVSDMAKRMNMADIAFGAGGTATWERIYMELPSMVTAIAENQVESCEACASAGFIKYLGKYDCVDVKDLQKAIEEFIDNPECIQYQTDNMKFLYKHDKEGFI